MTKKKKTIAQLKKKLQPIFNRVIRLRACGDDGGNDCISCGRWFKFEDLDCGHFFHVKRYDNLRFNEDNCSSECQDCNRFNDSHLINYSMNLKNKIGSERILNLRGEARKYEEFRNQFKWNHYELEELIVYYTQELRILEGKYL